MAKTAPTVKTTASAASIVLTSRTASKSEKQVAASALALTTSKVVTSKGIASKAGKILKDPKASNEARTVAASALIQWPVKAPKNAAEIRDAVNRITQRKN